jgi:hypothetical protein
VGCSRLSSFSAKQTSWLPGELISMRGVCSHGVLHAAAKSKQNLVEHLSSLVVTENHECITADALSFIVLRW